MLPDRYRQLLTAYVDGELPRRQLRRVERLLKHSPAARQLLTQLQADARSLRHLPRPHLPADLTGTILQAIADRGLQPAPAGRSPRFHPRPGLRPGLRPVAPFPAWTGLAVAASLLCVIGLASYFYFSLSFDSHQPGGSPPGLVVKHSPGNPGNSGNSGNIGNPEKPDVGTNPTPPQDPGGVAVATPGDSGTKPPSDQPRDPADKPETGNPNRDIGVARNPAVSPMPPGMETDPNPEMPRDPARPPGSVLTDRPPEGIQLEVARVILPAAPFPLHELDQAAQQERLAAELGGNSGFRLELPTLEGTRALERLLAVCKAQNIRTHIEPAEQLRLKNPIQWKASHAVYLEGIPSRDLIRLLEQLGSDDRKAKARRPADGLFDRLVLLRMHRADHKDLADTLGIETPEAQGKGPLGTDLKRPIAEQTADQVARTLVDPKNKRPEQRALVVSYPLARSSRTHPEVKQYLETRHPVAPGTVQVLLVLRHLGN